MILLIMLFFICVLIGPHSQTLVLKLNLFHHMMVTWNLAQALLNEGTISYMSLSTMYFSIPVLLKYPTLKTSFKGTFYLLQWSKKHKDFTRFHVPKAMIKVSINLFSCFSFYCDFCLHFTDCLRTKHQVTFSQTRHLQTRPHPSPKKRKLGNFTLLTIL